MRKFAVFLFLLADLSDDVFSESVHAHIEPETHYVLDCLADCGIVVVEVGLLFGVEVEIKLASFLIVFPSRSREGGHPVVRGFLAVLASALFPNVEIRVRLFSFAGFFEPFVLVTRMIDDEIHDDFESDFMRFVKHGFEVVEGAVFGCYILVVGNIIAVVALRRRIEWTEPHGVRTKRFYVIEF